MKIGILIPEFPGQTHSFFWREIVNLRARHGIDVAIVSTRRPPRPVMHEWVADAPATYLYPAGLVPSAALALRSAPALPGLLRDPDIRACLAVPRNWGLLAMGRRLADVCRAEGVSHLHVHSCANAALIAAFANRLSGLPYSVVLHGPLAAYGPFQPLKWRHAAFGFVVTETLRREVARELPGVEPKLRVAPMGVDTDAFAPAGQPRSGPSTGFRWFCCGRLSPQKGYDTLIGAAVLLRARAPDLSFTIEIAGEDSMDGAGYRREVERMIAGHDLGQTIVLRGAIPQSEVLAALRSADGFVLPSHNEAIGVAYMEAMSCGLPTIGTRTGGVAELIDDGRDGRLVPPGQPEALATAMQDIMADPPGREALGRAARQKIVDGFAAHRSADMLAGMLLPRTEAGTEARTEG
jgi:glycosyltransferase involved in cell wall biosynthesis